MIRVPVDPLRLLLHRLADVPLHPFLYRLQTRNYDHEREVIYYLIAHLHFRRRTRVGTRDSDSCPMQK